MLLKTNGKIIFNMLSAGCQLLIYPAAFNMTTGPAHWELLQKARLARLATRVRNKAENAGIFSRPDSVCGERKTECLGQ